MAVKTTKIQCNQDVDLRGKADIEGKVTCGSDVEVDGALTINSAKDLKTKDGTSFGGGGLPSPWSASEKVLGFEDTQNKMVIGFLSEGGFLYGYQDGQAGEVCYLSPVYLGNTSIVVYVNAKTQVESEIVLPYDFLEKSQVINLGDINKKQATLYRHTVRIENNSRKASLSFMTESEKNTKVDSIQDLIAVFGNTTVGVSGYAHYDTYGYVLLALTVGTDITTTKVAFIDTVAGESVQLSFSDIFGTDGLFITDNVTTM